MTHRLIFHGLYIPLNLILFDFTTSYNIEIIFTSKNNINYDSMRATILVLIWVWEGHASQAEPFHFISRHKSPAGRRKNNEEQASMTKYSQQFENTLLAILAIIVQCAHPYLAN